MKRNTISLILIFLAILTILTGCKTSNKVIENGLTQEEGNITQYNSYILKWESYGTWKEDIDKVIISNTDQLQKFCIKLENEDESYVMADRLYRSAELFKDYDEEYFKNKSLAILGVDLGNGNQYINLKKAIKQDTSVKIDYEIDFSNESGITAMRKCFIVVEIDKDITNIISNCLTPEYSYNDISLSVKPNTVTSKGATFIIKNNSNETYCYGAEYRIETKVNGQWKDIELKEPLAWNEIAYIINARELREINIDFTYGYGELEKGEYRLVKKVFKEEKASGDEIKFKYVYAEFEI